MAGGDDLGMLARREIGQEIVDVALPQDLKVGIRLVEQEDRAGIGEQVAEQEEDSRTLDIANYLL